MKGQLSIEFMVILLILVVYLTTVFSMFASVRGSLEKAVDRKVAGRLDEWARFIAARPKGTELRVEISPFPGRYLSISCPDNLHLETPTYSVVSVPASCPDINITKKTRISIESTGGGVSIEVS